MRTVLVGTWIKNEMVAACESKIVAERCNNGLKEIKVRPVKPAECTTVKFQRPNLIRISDNPTAMDPYEKTTIYIQEGVKEDGVFAKRDIQEGELISYYSGNIFDRLSSQKIQENITTQED